MKTETRRIANGNKTVTRGVIELAGNMDYSPAEALRAARINRSRAQYMTGRTVAGLPLGEAMVAFYDGLMAGLKDVNLQKQREQLLINAASRDPQVAAVARKTLASLRVEVFSNYLYAPALWMNQYAEVINLKDDERPIAQRNTKQEVAITGVGGDGSPHMVKISLDPDETLIPLGYLTTDIVRYRKVDIYRGRVVDPALARFSTESAPCSAWSSGSSAPSSGITLMTRSRPRNRSSRSLQFRSSAPSRTSNKSRALRRSTASRHRRSSTVRKPDQSPGSCAPHDRIFRKPIARCEPRCC